MLKITDVNFLITIPNNENINVSVVYNRDFFGLFDFENYHVHSFGIDIPIESESDTSVQHQRSIDLDENDDDLQIATEILGKEKIPDGYSQLPLQSGGSLFQSIQESFHDTYGKFSKYLTLPPDTETVKEELVDPTIQNKDVRVIFPKKDFHVTPLSDMLSISDDPSIFTFSTHFDYHEIEQFVKDMIFQLEYFENEGVIFKDITTDSIFKVQDRFLIIDSTNMDVFKDKSQTKSINQSIYKLIIALMGKTRNDSLYIVPHTKLYYMLHRLEHEHVLAWI
jgi:hypothetical protein